MAIKNLTLETIGLHVGYKDYSKTTSQQIPYKKSGVLTILLKFISTLNLSL